MNSSRFQSIIRKVAFAFLKRRPEMPYPAIEGLLEPDSIRARQYPVPNDPAHQELHEHLSKPGNASLSWWPGNELVFNDHVCFMWYVVPRMLGCLPTQLLSASAGLQHQKDESLELAFHPPSPWEPRFMDLVTQISSFGMFMDNPKLVQICIQLAVVVKTINCQPWIFEDPIGDFYLGTFSEIARRNCRNLSAGEIHARVKRKLAVAGLYLSITGHMFDNVIGLDVSDDGSQITGDKAPSVNFVTADHLEYLIRCLTGVATMLYDETFREWRRREINQDPAPCDGELRGLLGKAQIAEMLQYRGSLQTRLPSLGEGPPQVAAVATLLSLQETIPQLPAADVTGAAAVVSLAPAKIAEPSKPKEGAAPAIVAGQPSGH